MFGPVMYYDLKSCMLENIDRRAITGRSRWGCHLQSEQITGIWKAMITEIRPVRDVCDFPYSPAHKLILTQS
jgi:hypothetical protein